MAVLARIYHTICKLRKTTINSQRNSNAIRIGEKSAYEKGPKAKAGSNMFWYIDAHLYIGYYTSTYIYIKVKC